MQLRSILWKCLWPILAAGSADLAEGLMTKSLLYLVKSGQRVLDCTLPNLFGLVQWTSCAWLATFLSYFNDASSVYFRLAFCCLFRYGRDNCLLIVKYISDVKLREMPRDDISCKHLMTCAAFCLYFFNDEFAVVCGFAKLATVAAASGVVAN